MIHLGYRDNKKFRDLSIGDFLTNSPVEPPLGRLEPRDPKDHFHIKNLIAATAISVGVTLLLRKPLSKAIGSYIRGAAKAERGFLSSLARRASEYGAFKLGEASAVDVLRLSKSWVNLESTVKSIFHEPVKALEAFREYSKAEKLSPARKLYYFWSPRKIEGYTRLQRAGGYFYKKVTESLSFIPLSYAIDRAFHLTGDEPKLTDIKGNVKHFARYSASLIAFDLLPAGIAAPTAILGRHTLNLVSRVTNTETGRRFFIKALEYAAKTSSKLGSYRYALTKTIRELNQHVTSFLPLHRVANKPHAYNYRLNIRDFPDKIAAIKRSFLHHLQIGKQARGFDITIPDLVQAKKVAGKRFLDEITEKVTGVKSGPAVKEFIEDLVRERKPNKHKTLLEKLFGFQRVDITEEHLKKLIEQLKNQGLDADEIKSILEKDVLKSRTVYTADGIAVDLSRVSPKYLARLIDKKLSDSRFAAVYRILGAKGILSRIGATDYFAWSPQYNAEFVSPSGRIYSQAIKINDINHTVEKYIYSKGKVYALLQDIGLVKLPGEEDLLAIYSPGVTLHKRIISDFAKVKTEDAAKSQRAPSSLLERVRRTFRNSFWSKLFSRNYYYEHLIDDLLDFSKIDSPTYTLEKGILYRRLEQKVMSKFDNVVQQQSVRDLVEELSEKRFINSIKNPFKLSSKELTDELSSYLNVVSGKTAIHNRAARLAEELRAEADQLGLTVDELLEKLPKRREAVESVLLLGELGKLRGQLNLSEEVLSKLGADERVIFEAADIFANAPPHSFTNIDSLDELINYIQQNKDRLVGLRNVFASERVFSRDLLEAFVVDNPFERVYGREVPYYFVKRGFGIKDIASSLVNLFAFAPAEAANPDEENILSKIIRYGTTNKLITGVEDTEINQGYLWFSTVTSRLKRLAYEVGVGGSVYEPLLAHYNTAFMARKVKQLMFLSFAWGVTDYVTARAPIFEGTALDEGTNKYVAEKVAQAKLLEATLRDKLGITSVSQYMEALAPGSSTIVPGAVLGAAGSLAGGPFAPIGGAAAGIAVAQIARSLGIFTPYKSADEVADEVSGRSLVPMKRHRFWFLSLEPFAGEGTDYYIPSWIARARALTPEQTGRDLLGAVTKTPLPFLGFNPIGFIFDRYYREREHYFTRPYPYTGRIFADIPFTGPVTGVIGRALKPQVLMHQQELAVEEMLNPPVIEPEEPGTSGEVLSDLFRKAFIEPTGLTGYKVECLVGEQPFSPRLIYAEAFRKETENKYWEASFGDILFGGTELARRFFPAPRGPLTYNPIRNMMPSEFPEELTHGDPYAAIPHGELRLPGMEYEMLHDVSHTFPAKAGDLGKDPSSMVLGMLGLLPPDQQEIYDSTPAGRMAKQKVQSLLIQKGRLVARDKMIYDVENDIVGVVDAIIRDYERGKEIQEPLVIKPTLEVPLEEPREQDIAEMNFYLSMLNMKRGKILYLNLENPEDIAEYTIWLNPGELKHRLDELKAARQKASEAASEGIIKHTGASYSWLDRYRILSDVAPTSEEYHRADAIVRMQIAAGKLTDEEIKEYFYYKQLRNKKLVRYEFYPYRFSGENFMTETPGIEEVPSGSYEDTSAAHTFHGKEWVNYYNDNPYFVPATEFSLPERIVGHVWETLTHMNTFFHRKFINQYTPRQLYELQHVYGDTFRPWNEPIKSWLRPQINMIRGAQSPIEAAWHGGVLGYIFGGPTGAMAGAVAGNMANVTQKIVDRMKGEVWVPENVRFRNKLYEWTELLSYYRSKMNYNLTGSVTALDEMRKSIYAAHDRIDLFKAVDGPEKSYLSAFLNERDPEEQRRIYQLAPDYLKPFLAHEWGLQTTNLNLEMTPLELPGADWSGWNEAIPLDDIRAAIIHNEGEAIHDYGLGFGENALRMSDDYLETIAEDTQGALPPAVDTQHIVELLRSVVGRFGSVEISGHDPQYITIVIE